MAPTDAPPNDESVTETKAISQCLLHSQLENVQDT
jgi:hypothetical protein